MATRRPRCFARPHEFRDLWWYRIEPEHLHPFESSLFVIDDQGHHLAPFGSVCLHSSDHDDDFALEVTVAGRYAVLLDGRKEQPSSCWVYFTEQEISTVALTGGVVAHQDLHSTADLLAARVV
jgi:hypothetical protein